MLNLWCVKSPHHDVNEFHKHKIAHGLVVCCDESKSQTRWVPNERLKWVR